MGRESKGTFCEKKMEKAGKILTTSISHFTMACEDLGGPSMFSSIVGQKTVKIDLVHVQW